MDAFAAAAAVLHEDPNLTVGTDYTLAGSKGPAIPGVRVILVTSGDPGGSVRSGAVEVALLAAAIHPYGRPVKNDTIDLADGRRFRVEDAELDAEGLEYRLRCSALRP